jgi:hypothetical protein
MYGQMLAQVPLKTYGYIYYTEPLIQMMRGALRKTLVTQ